MNKLIKYDAACRALAECRTIDEVKTWADKAAAMQAYGRMAKDKTLEVDAAEIRIRAERRLGELLAQAKAAGGLNREANLRQNTELVSNEVGKTAPTLADAGISYDLSSRAQKMAAVPEAEFEQEVGAWRERVKAEGERVSSRLQQAGKRQMEKQGDEMHELAVSPEVLVRELHAENLALIERIKAMEADDQKAETLKWRRLYEHASREQSVAMDRAHDSQKREKWTMSQLARCGKAVGEENPTKIAATVEAMARASRAA